MFISSPARLNDPPKRIISTVPSITELLFHLGLDKETAAITKFCVHPEEWFRKKIRIGGTKKLDIDRIKAIGPDLVICNKEENVREEIELLAARFPVYLTDIKTVADALEMIKFTGLITGKGSEAARLVAETEHNFARLCEVQNPKIRTAYFIWKDPYMTIGSDTFISDMMNRAGFENVYADCMRYPEVDLEDLKMRDPQLVLLSSEPYPFREKHIAMMQDILPASKFLTADGEMFSWYGSRMLLAPGYFAILRNRL